MENNNIETKYRWYVLSLGAITLALCLATPYICIPVLFNEISTDLGLNLVQIGWIWGIFPLSGFFTVFASGLLADRFGAKRMLIFACSISGLAGASRGLANDFTSLLFTTFLSGLFMGFILNNVFKMAATWFPSRQLGIASGILTTGIGIGFTLASMVSATLISPMLGGWRRVLLLYGAISIFVGLLWLITIKEQQHNGGTLKSDKVKSIDAISHVLRNKNIWLISFAMLGYLGCTEGMCGYLPLYLRDIKGWLPHSADFTLSAFTGASTLAAIPISLLSDRLGRRKFIILCIMSIIVIGMGLLSIADGLIIWIIVILVGMSREGLLALATASIIDSKGIGMLFSGTAIGLSQTIYRIGQFISPPIANSTASIGAGFPYIVWAAFALFAWMCFSLTKETGHKLT